MRTPRHAGDVVIGRRAEAERHLDAATLAGLGARERSLVLHVAACAACRRRLAANQREQRAWTPGAAADAAIVGLLREVEVEEVALPLAAIQRERREATERVGERHSREPSRHAKTRRCGDAAAAAKRPGASVPAHA